MPGEELTYNVRYGFIDLGQVKIRTLHRSSDTLFYGYDCLANIGSYAGVPFVDLRATYASTVDSGMFARRFEGRSKDGKIWQYSRYAFDYPGNRVLVETGTRDSIVDARDTMETTGHLQDGLSLFFYARDQVTSGRRMNVPTFVKEEKVNTFLNFPNRRTTVTIDPVDYPIDVVQFDGTAEFVGIFGLTGDFEGWFSNDDARVPIVAKMKVIIGSITLELMEWKRPGWTPPRGRE